MKTNHTPEQTSEPGGTKFEPFCWRLETFIRSICILKRKRLYWITTLNFPSFGSTIISLVKRTFALPAFILWWLGTVQQTSWTYFCNHSTSISRVKFITCCLMTTNSRQIFCKTGGLNLHIQKKRIFIFHQSYYGRKAIF